MPNIKGSLENLRRQLRSIRFNHDVSFQGMISGQPSAFVEFYRHLLCDFNSKVTSHLVELGFGMLGTTDKRFMEVLYRILRDVFSFRPPITTVQFFTTGFAERKIEMATTVAFHIGSLIKNQDKNRIHFNDHHQRLHENRNNHNNHNHNDHIKTNSNTQMPSMLPGVSWHRSAERSVEKLPVSCHNSKCVHYSEKNPLINNEIDCCPVLNDHKTTVLGGEYSRESHHSDNYRDVNEKEAKFNKTKTLNTEDYSRDQFDKFKNDYDQYKFVSCSHHLLDNNYPPRPYTSNALYENSMKLSDYKLTATTTSTTSINKMNNTTSMVPIRSFDCLNDLKQHSKENYYTSSSFTPHHNDSNTNNEHLLLKGNNNIASVISHQSNQSNSINPEDIQNIMNSLSQLTGKVNGMLARINKLESKLTYIEPDCSFNHRLRTYSENTAGSYQHHTDSNDIYGSRNIVKPTTLPTSFVPGKYNSCLPMNLTDSFVVISNDDSSTLDTLTETKGTFVTTITTTNSIMSSLTMTTATTTTTYGVTSSYIDRHYNNKLSESLLSKPKYLTSSKLNIQDNDNYDRNYSVAANNQTMMSKTENRDTKIPINDDYLLIKHVPNTFHDSYKFTENLHDLLNQHEILDSIHSKNSGSLKTINHRSSKLFDPNTCSSVDLDLQSEISSPFSIKNSVSPFRSKSSSDYYVKYAKSNPVENSYQHKMTIPSLTLNLSCKSVQPKVSTNQNAEASYRAQVERITNMLAETQNLLQEHSPVVKMNEMLNGNQNNNNDYHKNNTNNITSNDDNCNNAVMLKA
ncbi:unnamed protein product [Schistosoma turkestanicum]|nr:unnamed protein product [Schistosoma turkestanicum]